MKQTDHDSQSYGKHHTQGDKCQVIQDCVSQNDEQIIGSDQERKVFKSGPVTVEQVVNEALSACDFVVLECNDQTEHRQEAEQNVPDGGRQRHDGQLRVILGPASFFLFAWFTQDFFLLLPINRAYHLIRLSYKRNPGK